MKPALLLLLFASAVSGQSLGLVLGWKHPGVQGITTRDGKITEWPSQLGSVPDQATIDTWRAEYNAAGDNPTKQAKIDRTNEIMARWVEQLTVTLHSKAILLTADIPKPVRDAIDARRALRGDPPIAW